MDPNRTRLPQTPEHGVSATPAPRRRFCPPLRRHSQHRIRFPPHRQRMQHRPPRSKPRRRPHRRMRQRQHHSARRNRHHNPAANFQPRHAHPHAAQKQRRNTQLLPFRARAPVIQRADLQTHRPDPMQPMRTRRTDRRNNSGTMHMPPPTEDVPRRDGEGVGRLKSVQTIRSGVFPGGVLLRHPPDA